MQKNRHIAIWLRMLATFEIRYARIAKSLLKAQAVAVSKSYEQEGGTAAEETLRKGQKTWEQILTVLYAQTIAHLEQYTLTVLLGGAQKQSMQMLVQRFIANESLKHSKLITGTSLDKVRTVIQQGYANGLDERVIAENINKALGDDAIADSRARMIARTETHNAATFGLQATAEETRLPLRRQWVTVEDSRVRGSNVHDLFSHVDADGQERGMDEPFLVSGELLDRPGDPAGSPGNIINCRCTIIYVNDTTEMTGASSGEESE